MGAYIFLLLVLTIFVSPIVFIIAPPSKLLKWLSLGLALLTLTGSWIIVLTQQGDTPPCHLVLSFALAAIGAYRQWFIHPPLKYPAGQCQTCGYNLTGNVSGICPECGNKIITPTEPSNGNDTVIGAMHWGWRLFVSIGISSLLYMSVGSQIELRLRNNSESYNQLIELSMFVFLLGLSVTIFIVLTKRYSPKSLRRIRRDTGSCIRCGHDLSGKIGNACPECGLIVEDYTDNVLE